MNTQKNALSHGLYSDCITLEGEDPDKFNEMVEKYREDFPPQNIAEEDALFALASLHWKRQRFEGGLQKALNRQRALDQSNGKSTWEDFADSARKAAKSQLEAAGNLCQGILKFRDGIFADPPKVMDESQAAEYEKLTILAKEVSVVGAEVNSMLQVAEQQRQQEIDRAFNPDITERGLKILAEFDRRIEKAMRRLVMIKQYKELYLAKSVPSKHVEALPVKLTNLNPNA
jgi:hypothetical protein